MPAALPLVSRLRQWSALPLTVEQAAIAHAAECKEGGWLRRVLQPSACTNRLVQGGKVELLRTVAVLQSNRAGLPTMCGTAEQLAAYSGVEQRQLHDSIFMGCLLGKQLQGAVNR